MVKDGSKSKEVKPGKSSKNKKTKRKRGEEKIWIPTSGRVIGKKVFEIVIGEDVGDAGFVMNDCRSGGKLWAYEVIKNGRNIYYPMTNKKFIWDNIVKIPRRFERLIGTNRVVRELKKFITKYVYIPDEVDLQIVVTYVLLTWAFERFSSIPYLRAVGDFGSGKSRLLKVLNVCYKSIYTSGLASSAPIFRLIDMFGGTLIIDEAEFFKNTERVEDIKEILRFGKDSDGVVTRCDPKTNDPIPFKVFGPKVLASKYPYNDAALESRIIDIKMEPAKFGKVPIGLDRQKFFAHSEYIRSLLLGWRLRNYFNININSYKNYLRESLSSRLNEIHAPLICIRQHDKGFIKKLMDKAEEKYSEMKKDKAESLEAIIVKEILLSKYRDGKNLTGLGILSIRVGTYRNINVSSRLLGKIMRNTLKLETKHMRDGATVVYNEKRIKELIKQYFLEPFVKEMEKAFNKKKK